MKTFSFFLVFCSLLVLFSLNKSRFLTKTKYLGSLNTHKVFRTKEQNLKEDRQNYLSERWFENQKLDHFDLTNKQTWRQRYFINATYWRPSDKNSPVYLMLGGEGPDSAKSVQGHFIINNYAKETNGLIISIEHRFYGKSNPTNDLSTRNLKYLSAEQALYDFAEFIQYIKETFLANDRYSSTRKWVAIGGSYSGNLAAWFRLKFPHLIHASIASSAPVVAQLRYPEYMQHIGQSLGQSCSSRVKQANKVIEKNLYEMGQSGIYKMEQLFKTCDPIKSDDDKITFLSSLSDPICGTVQYNLDHPNTWNITYMCSIIENSDSDPVKALANFMNLYRMRAGDQCVDSNYDKMISELRDTSTFPNNPNAAGRSWTYQYCNEYGYLQYATPSSPFSEKISFEYMLNMCERIFNIPNFQPDIKATNTNFGSNEIRSSRITFASGSIDPWTELCLHKDIGSSQIYLPIIGTGHCANIYAPRDSDLQSLKDVRAKEWNYLRKFLYAEK